MKTMAKYPAAIISAVVMFAASCAFGAGPIAVSPRTEMSPLLQTSQGKPYQLSLGIGAGYLTGESAELVYWPDQDNHKASELTWNIDSLFMFGINAELKLGSRFSVNFDGWFKAFDGDATMDDYDWMTVGGDWTDWSHHDNTDVTDATIFDISASFCFLPLQNMNFNVVTGYRRDSFGWDARGGSYIYSESGFRDSTGTFDPDEPGISYEQTFTSLYFGVSMDADFGNILFKGRIIYSPWVKGEAVDNHYARNLITYDDADDGSLFLVDFSGVYYFTDRLGLEAGFTYESYDTMQGNSVWVEDGVTSVLADSAGMDHSSTLVRLMLRYSLN